MDKIRGVIDPEKFINNLRVENLFLPEDLLIILGPTASGKTKFAVACAEILHGQIISADSRQVYRHMNIGTGKDLNAYGSIPYHLIDVVDAGDKYNIHQFLNVFKSAYQDIVSRGKQAIEGGGTELYIQSLIQPQPYTQVPVDEVF